MKMLFSLLIISCTLNTLIAQESDSLRSHPAYQRAWNSAMSDGKISPEERVLMNILGDALNLSSDSVRFLETSWKTPEITRLLETPDQSGRWPLVLQNMVLGAGLYGWAVPYVLQAEDARWFVGSEMMSMSGAFYLTYKYTKAKSVSHSRAQMMRYGSLLGLRYGLGINQLLELNGGEGNQRETIWAWVLMASVPAGHIGGDYLFEKHHPSNGQAWTWTMWTGVAGLTSRLIYSVMDAEPQIPEYSGYYYDEELDKEYQNNLSDWEKRRTVLELLSYPLGTYVGYQLTRDKNYSFGDALMLMQGWGFGFYNTMMLQSIFADDIDTDILFMVSALGAIGSSLAYDRWIKVDDFSFGQSTLMLLGSGSGIAFGFGTGILLNVDSTEPLLTLALAGYGAGTWLTRSILEVESDGSLASNSSTRISFSPTIIPSLGSNQKTSLIPAFDLKISFK